jgi:hypothetical protein
LRKGKSAGSATARLASGAGADDFDGVRDIGVALATTDFGGPCLDAWPVDLDGSPAHPAQQMVVVCLGTALPVQGLTGFAAQDVDFTGVRQGFELVVDRGQPDSLAACAQELVQVLGGAKCFEVAEQARQGALLLRRTLTTRCQVYFIDGACLIAAVLGSNAGWHRGILPRSVRLERSTCSVRSRSAHSNDADAMRRDRA